MVSPQGLVKKLVGETLTVAVELPGEHAFEVEVFTNLNHSKGAYPLFAHRGVYVGHFPLTESGYFTWQVRFRRRGTRTWKFVRDGEGKRLSNAVQVDPAWLARAVVYNVFVRFFSGKPLGSAVKPGDGGTFDDVKHHLDELSALGVSALYFNPIHLIGEVHRKYNMMDQLPSYLQPGSPYSIKDYKSIDPELTYDRDTKKHLLADPAQEFRDLVEAAHERGMFVIMDLVFNHTAHDFVFQRIRPEWYLYKEDIMSLSAAYLYPEDIAAGKPWGDARYTFCPYDHGSWWEDVAQLNWEYMIPEGPNLPPKNTTLAEMWEYFKSIPQYWIQHFGVDGFRCDIAYRVPPAFWKACIAEARQAAHLSKTNLCHDVAFIAESYENNLVELQEAGFAAVYGGFSYKLSSPLALKGYLDYMYNLSGAHFPSGSKWFIFPESHDFERMTQKILGNEPDADKALLVNQSRWVLSATLPGIPLIFNGFEKIEWQPVNLFSYGAVNWGREADLKEFIGKINALRGEHVALQRGSYLFLPTNQGMDERTQLFAFLRRYQGEALVVVVNMDVHGSAGPATVFLPEEFSGSYRLTDLLTKQAYVRAGRELLVQLPPGSAHIFLVEGTFGSVE